MVENSLKKTSKEKEPKDKELQQKQEEETRSGRKKRKWFGVRKFPIIFRIIVVLILLVVALMLGVMVGYGVIGDGNAKDALNKETWQHIIDIVEKK